MRLRAASLVACLLIGIGLRLPIVDAGLRDDDHVQLAMLEGAFPVARGPLDLFWFSGRDAGENRVLRDAGYLPWWASDELRLGMLRPLSSALVALDHALFGRDARMRHVHSLLWWALLVAAVGIVFAQLLPQRTAALALLLFAVDESHAVPLAYVANRSALVSAAFGLLALGAHLRWRERGARHGGWITACFACLALCGGEYALSALAYVFAYELMSGSGSVRERARALLPVGVPAAGYLGLRAALGYGARASGHYVTPLELPRYLEAAARRLPLLTGDLVLAVPSAWHEALPLRERALRERWLEAETLRALPDWHALHWGVGLLALALLLGGLRWTARTQHPLASRLRWLIVGALLSLVPAVGTLPSERTLLAGAVGMAALVAVLAGQAATRAVESRRLWAALGLVVLLLPHAIAAPVRAWTHATAQPGIANALTAWAARASFPKAHAEGLDVVVVSAADFATASSLPWARRTLGAGLPRSYRRLDASAQPLELTRVADDVIELRVLAADVAGSAAGSLYRAASAPIEAGYRVHLPRLEVEVLAARMGNPVHTRFRFSSGAEQGRPRWLVLQATRHGLTPLALPPIGARRVIPAPQRPLAR